MLAECENFYILIFQQLVERSNSTITIPKARTTISDLTKRGFVPNQKHNTISSLFVFIYIKTQTTPPSKRLVKSSAWQKKHAPAHTQSRSSRKNPTHKKGTHTVQPYKYEHIEARAHGVWCVGAYVCEPALVCDYVHEEIISFYLNIHSKTFQLPLRNALFFCWCHWRNRCEGGDKIQQNQIKLMHTYCWSMLCDERTWIFVSKFLYFRCLLLCSIVREEDFWQTFYCYMIQ